MKKYLGINIREVWDYRLSTCVPMIDRKGGTWVVKIFSKSNPDYDPKNKGTEAVPLEQFDTGIKSEIGDEHDTSKVASCMEWLRTVRDKYSLPNIEEVKPAFFVLRDLQAVFHLCHESTVLPFVLYEKVKSAADQAGTLYAKNPKEVFTITQSLREDFGTVAEYVESAAPILNVLLEDK